MATKPEFSNEDDSSVLTAIVKHEDQTIMNSLSGDREDPEQLGPKTQFYSKKALWAFLILCYSVRGLPDLDTK